MKNKFGTLVFLLIVMSLNAKAQNYFERMLYGTNGFPLMSEGLYPYNTGEIDFCEGYPVRIYDANVRVVDCPIDGYTFCLLFSVSVVGVFYIRKKN